MAKYFLYSVIQQSLTPLRYIIIYHTVRYSTVHYVTTNVESRIEHSTIIPLLSWLLQVSFLLIIPLNKLLVCKLKAWLITCICYLHVCWKSVRNIVGKHKRSHYHIIINLILDHYAIKVYSLYHRSMSWFYFRWDYNDIRFVLDKQALLFIVLAH